MAAKNRRNKCKNRLLPPTPEQIRQRREAAENSRLERAAQEKAAGKRIENWGMNNDGGLYDYQRHIGTQTTMDRAGKVRSAWRSNPFKLLLESGALSQDEANAAHDLMAIYARSKGLAGAPANTGIVIDGGDPDAWGAEDRRQYNIRLYGMIIESLTAKSANLARAFAFAIVEQDRPMPWRGIVAQAIGEDRRDRQTARMQVMCEELCDKIPICRNELKWRTAVAKPTPLGGHRDWPVLIKNNSQ